MPCHTRPTDKQPPPPTGRGHLKEEHLTFSLLLSSAFSLPLPSEAWAVQVLDGFSVKSVVFPESAVPKNYDKPLFTQKALEVMPSRDDPLSVRTFIYGYAVTLGDTRKDFP